jgi:hypothetical protein
MNIELIQRAAEESNSDQLFAYIREAMTSDKRCYTSHTGYELNSLANAYEEGIIGDFSFCSQVIEIFED